MIVDLLRNDLGRVLHEAGGGQVRVRSLFDVEPYESQLQMTSAIDGTQDWGSRITVQNLFKGLVPCGSIISAPKIRTMEIIHELEKGSRGVYTGGIGFLTSPIKSGPLADVMRRTLLGGSRGGAGGGTI